MRNFARTPPFHGIFQDASQAKQGQREDFEFFPPLESLSHNLLTFFAKIRYSKTTVLGLTDALDMKIQITHHIPLLAVPTN